MTRKKAQPQKNSTKIRTYILSAALEVASVRQWEFVSLIEIADSAGLQVNDITSVYAAKSDILEAIIDDLDNEVVLSFPDYDEDIPARDRIFDVLMERFDIANPHRDAHISFFKSFGWTQNESCADISLMKKSMTRMAKCAGLDTNGLSGALAVTGLSMAYLWVVLTWINDTSPDLSKTMAELDKTLGRIDMLKSMIKNYAARSPSSS
jgi:hypothetical protein